VNSTEIMYILLSAGITIFSLNLLIVSLLSYRRYRGIKLLFLSVVFLLFFFRGIILSYNVFSGNVGDQNAFLYLWVLDLIILVFLYITSLKR
jgi:hypothetical protein